MKKILLFLIPIIIIIGVGIYFGSIEEEPVKEYTVTFYETQMYYCNCVDCGCPTGPKLVNTVKVKEGEKVSKPDDLKQDGRTFVGWVLDNESNTELFDFDTPITKDINLYSKWNDTTVDYKLMIKESSWSGWSKDYKPNEVTNKYDVVLNKEYSINNGKFTFVIKEVENDHVVIKTNQYFSDNETGVNLNTDKMEFTVNFEKETKLTTPTTDAGDIYYLILVK